MWLEAVDLVLHRLRDDGLDFSKVKGVSGAGLQHGTIFWSNDAEPMLGGLDAGKTLLEQLEGGSKGERKGAFSHPFSPNWQDASTQKQCDAFDARLGSPEKLAEVTGSKAHHVCSLLVLVHTEANGMSISASVVPKSSASTINTPTPIVRPPVSPSCLPSSLPYS